MNSFSFADVLAHELGRGVARFANNVENADVFFRHRVADEAGPGLVGANRAGLAEFAHDIEQDEITALDWGGGFFCWKVMRVRGVRVNGDDALFPSHAFFIESSRDELLNIVFGDR